MKSTYNFPNNLPARRKQDNELMPTPTREEVTDLFEKHKKDAIRVLRIWLCEDKKLK